MVIYIADRYGEILATAATDLPQNRTIIDDKLTDTIASGVKVFECSLQMNKEQRDAAVTGNYVMAYDRPFMIVQSTLTTSNNTIELYCEDAGLSFINKIVGTVKSTSKTLRGWIEATIGTEGASGWEYVFNVNEQATKTLEYTSESTALERLLDILANYDLEMFFSYSIEGMEWAKKTINFTERRGNADSAHHLYIDKDISEIRREESILNLATVWKMYGKDNKALEKLSGYSSATKTITTANHTYSVVGSEVRCTDAIDTWKSKLDTDGRIVQVKYTEYTKAANCISYAVREMDKIVDPVYTYEVSFVKLPDDLECGDYVYILDAHDEILASARVIEWSRSETKNIKEATLGDFVTLQSGIADIDFSRYSIYTLSISSSNGLTAKDSLTTSLSATVYHNGDPITSAEDLLQGELHWYVDDVEVTNNSDPTTFPYIANDGFTLQTGTITTGHTYVCRLEE